MGKFIFLLQILSAFLLAVNCHEKSSDELFKYLDSGINHSVNPCDNFYDYACGNWAKNNPKPDGFKLWNLKQMTKRNIISKMRNILESNSFQENKQLDMERKYYQACINSDATILTTKNFLMNMISESTESMRTWQDVAEYYASKIGFNFLFQIVLKSGILQILRPHEATSNKSKSEKLNMGMILKYLNSTTHTRLLKYSRQSINVVNNEFHKFVSSVRKLVNSPKSELRRLNISELQEIYNRHCPKEKIETHVNWYKLLQKHAEGSEVVIENEYQINIDIEYLINLCKIISITPSIVIVSYMQFNLLFDPNVVFYINSIKNHQNFEKTPYACIDRLPLKEKIYELLADSDEFYEIEETANKLYEGLRVILKEEIRNSWFNNETIEEALRVVRKIEYHISRTDFPVIKKELEVISYKFSVGSLALENLINFKKAQTVHKIELSQKFANVESRKKRNIEINAAYNRETNILSLTTGLLFAPLFEPKAHLISYLYGILGFTIGHEISHAFDYSRIIQYLGDYITINQRMKSILIEKKDCMIRQFNKLGMDGSATLNENIADTQGLKLVYKLLRKTIPSSGRGRSEIKRYFFLSFANGYCESRDTPYTDTVHSPPVMRVVGTLMNMPEFAKLYHCKEGQAMNPREKCDLWSVPSEPMEM